MTLVDAGTYLNMQKYSDAALNWDPSRNLLRLEIV
jgi:hypothetical protein